MKKYFVSFLLGFIFMVFGASGLLGTIFYSVDNRSFYRSLCAAFSLFIIMYTVGIFKLLTIAYKSN